MAETMPAADWTRRRDLARLIAVLGPGNARYVGGAVRDTLLGLVAHDIDCATPLDPAQVIDRLARADIRTVPTGLKHGTVTAILDSGNVEVTTLRRDVTTDGRHAEVAFSRDWREDAARRDFTINALYADPDTLAVHDYFGGLEDLHQGRVRFIGDARQRIREDHLRILRYFRFQARFGRHGADAQAEDACADLAPMLKGLSRERVGWELRNLLALPDPAPIVARMHELGVLSVILPETGARELIALADLIAAERAAGIAPDAIRRLAAILPASPPVVEAVASRVRLSNSQRKRLACLASRDQRDGQHPRRLAYRYGAECARDRLLLTGADPAPVIGWDVPPFPLKGGTIVAAGVAAGPEVARILRAVEDRWVEEGFPDKRRIDELLHAELARD